MSAGTATEGLAMKFEDYHRWTPTTAQFPDNYPGQGLMYVGLGAAGEAGEIANQIKKVTRDDEGVLTPERFKKIHDEIGDVFWYLSQLCHKIGANPENVLADNWAKLTARKADGTIMGDRREDMRFPAAPIPGIANAVKAAATEEKSRLASSLYRCRTAGCGRAEWSEEGHCCHRCKYSGQHSLRCDRREAQQVSLSPAPAAGPAAEGVADSSGGAPAEGGGERRRADLDPLSFTEEDFANGWIPE